MPLYDYHCPHCKTEFELLVRSSSTPTCPSCQATDISRAEVSRLAPAGTTAGIIASARRQAKAEGHFSHYSRAEQAKIR